MTVIVTLEHCRKLKYCSRGVRIVFQRHNMDFMSFLQNGISGEALLKATNNDAMAKAAVDLATEESNNGRK